MTADSTTRWTTDLYVLATRGAGVPATQVMVTPHPPCDDQPDYADIICAFEIVDDVVDALAAEDYRFTEERGAAGSALRVRIRVYRDQPS